jgi:hypothetical protein
MQDGSFLGASASLDAASGLDCFNDLLRRFQQFFDTERLEQIAVAGSCKSVGMVVVPRDNNDPTSTLGSFSCQRHAILGAGKAYIDNGYIEVAGVERSAHLLTIAGKRNFITLLDKYMSQQLLHAFIVLDDQNATGCCGHGFLARSSHFSNGNNL